MNLNHLQTFSTVARLGSLTAAADELDVSKGLVSRHLQALERDLDVLLFHRTTRRITLTEAGEALYTRARQISDLSREAKQQILDLAREVSGALRITVPAELGRVIAREVVPDFVRDFPAVSLIMDISTALRDVEFGNYDLALRAYSALPDNVIARDLGTVKSVVVASPAFVERFRLEELSAPEQLVRTDAPALIVNAGRDDWNLWPFQKGADRVELELHGPHRIGNYGVAFEMACQGQGMACLPFYQVRSALERGELVQVLPDWCVVQHQFHILRARQRGLPGKIRAFEKTLLDWRRQHPEYFVEL
ncbi:LysR family transcriptional regulator [Kiloniella sp. b19]|uniref:LysR family transcriptional regulator n=1 Tax=Kiloniella sp. GXU_MW_B19 TaxID=3141326 RepID=UPI0031D1DC24